MEENATGMTLFSKYNEAITESLKTRFETENFGNIPSLEEKFREKNEWIASLAAEGSDTADDAEWLEHVGENVIFHYNSYPDERQDFNNILRMIAHKNPDRFTSQEEVFDLFARAYFTGHVLEVARLIESTLGKGSFRKIGEETKGEL